MFGFKVETRIRRDNRNDPPAEDFKMPHVDPDLYKDLLRHTALTVMSVMAVSTALGTTREILVNVTNPANR